MLNIRIIFTESNADVSRYMKCNSSEHLRIRFFEKLGQTLIHSEIRSSILHYKASFSIMEGVKCKIDCTTEQELLGIRNLFELFKELIRLAFSPESQISIELVEKEYM